MAIIVPYADLNAHGSLGGSVSFRRRFGRVILEKKPYPVQPNTTAQLAQRSAFATVQNDWYSYDAQSKGYYSLRGPQLGWSAKNLYTHARLLNIMPSQSHIGVKQIVQAQIIKPICPDPHTSTMFFSVWDSVGTYWWNLASIDDNENVLSNNPPGTSTYTKLRFQFWTDDNDLFRYGIWCQVKKMDDSLKELIIRCRSPKDPGVILFVSDDGSTFDDDALTHLNATNNF